MVKNPLPVQEMQETSVQSLGREDLLEKEMPTNSSILVWEVTEEPAGLESPWGGKELHTTVQLKNIYVNILQ